MRYKRQRFDLSTVLHATGTNNKHLKESIRAINDCENDPDREKRLIKSECKYCYYMCGGTKNAMHAVKMLYMRRRASAQFA